MPRDDIPSRDIDGGSNRLRQESRDRWAKCPQPFGGTDPLSDVTNAPAFLPLGPADAVLIRRFLDGDEPAFRALYDRHTPRLKMTICRLLGRRPHDVDDVLQETWLSACRSMHAFRGESKFSSWLTSIGVRATYALLSRTGRAEMELVHDIAAPQVGSPGSVIDLERALADLPDAQRIVVVLHDVEGFTHEEIAAQLGMAAGTSKATLSRARRVLRDALNKGATNAAS